ncbi:hypothetical protein [Spiroplasma endosymbiont of Labia minor]|uniref:hypothetical protein n=1 Tax=Spiroplasma endosymbiont of Labia minor TaxID=3066305 RepID=UPI0030D26BDF
MKKLLSFILAFTFSLSGFMPVLNQIRNNQINQNNYHEEFIIKGTSEPIKLSDEWNIFGLVSICLADYSVWKDISYPNSENYNFSVSNINWWSDFEGENNFFGEWTDWWTFFNDWDQNLIKTVYEDDYKTELIESINGINYYNLVLKTSYSMNNDLPNKTFIFRSNLISEDILVNYSSHFEYTIFVDGKE